MIWVAGTLVVVVLIGAITIVVQRSAILGVFGDESDAAEQAEASPPPAAAASPLPVPSLLVRKGRFTGQGVIVPVPDGWDVDRNNLAAGQVIVTPGDIVDTQRIVVADDVLTSPYSGLEGDSLKELVRQVRRARDDEPLVDKALKKFKGAERAHQLLFETASRTGATEGTEGTPPPGPPVRELMILAESPDGQFALFYYRALKADFNPGLARRLRKQAGLDPDSEPSRQQGGERSRQPVPTPVG